MRTQSKLPWYRLFIANSQRSFKGVACNFEGVCAEIKAGVPKVLQTRGGLGLCSPRKWMNNKIIVEFCFHMMWRIILCRSLRLLSTLAFASVGNSLLNLHNRTIAWWYHFTTTTQHSVPDFFQFVAFLCKWELLFFKPQQDWHGMDSGSCSQMSLLWKWPILQIILNLIQWYCWITNKLCVIVLFNQTDMENRSFWLPADDKLNDPDGRSSTSL